MDPVFCRHRGRVRGGAYLMASQKFTRDPPEVWFDAAYGILAEQGHGALTIENLTARTAKTRGSYYHHFGGLDGFVVALLHHWQERDTQRIIRLAQGQTSAVTRKSVLDSEAGRIDTRLEVAIRRWAGANEQAAKTCAAVDRLRVDALAAALRSEGGFTDAEAELLATMDYCLFVGSQVVGIELDQNTKSAMNTAFNALLDRQARR